MNTYIVRIPNADRVVLPAGPHVGAAAHHVVDEAVVCRPHSDALVRLGVKDKDHAVGTDPDRVAILVDRLDRPIDAYLLDLARHLALLLHRPDVDQARRIAGPHDRARGVIGLDDQDGTNVLLVSRRQLDGLGQLARPASLRVPERNVALATASPHVFVDQGEFVQALFVRLEVAVLLCLES